MSLGINSKIFYPSHGAGEIVAEKSIEFAGEEKRYFEFEFINKKLTISTPVQNLEKLGIRHVLPFAKIKASISELKTSPYLDPKVPDYNQLLEVINQLDLLGAVDSFVKIIQFANYEKKQREKDGRLIPVSITKNIKNAVSNIVGEMAVTQGVSYEKASEQFEKITDIKAD